MVKDPPVNAGDTGNLGSIPGQGRSLGEGNGNPLQYSCLENPMDRGAWWATVHGVPKELEMTEGLSTHASLELRYQYWINYQYQKNSIMFQAMEEKQRPEVRQAAPALDYLSTESLLMVTQFMYFFSLL